MNSSTPDRELTIAKGLLLLCWYLDYKRDGDYCESTRFDMIETVEGFLVDCEDDPCAVLEEAKEHLKAEFAGHPLSSQVEEALTRLLSGFRSARECSRTSNE